MWIATRRLDRMVHGRRIFFQLAIHEPRLAACVVNYGALPTDPNDFSRSARPCWEILARKIAASRRRMCRLSRKRCRGMNRRVDVKVYDGAGHGFENSTNANALSSRGGGRCLGAHGCVSESSASLSSTLRKAAFTRLRRRKFRTRARSPAPMR